MKDWTRIVVGDFDEIGFLSWRFVDFCVRRRFSEGARGGYGRRFGRKYGDFSSKNRDSDRWYKIERYVNANYGGGRR